MQAMKKYHHYNIKMPYQVNAVKRELALERRISPIHKSIMVRALFLIAALLIVMIGFMAYGVQVKYAINETEDEIATLQSQIDALNLEINEVASPTIIESKAKELGMVYPSADQRRYLNSADGSDVAFADAGEDAGE